MEIRGGMSVKARDCYACHSINLRSVEPTFKEIAERYKGDDSAEESLAKKIISGSRGSWGTASMSAHPSLTLEESRKMVRFILNFSKEPPKSMPLKGTHQVKLPGHV